MIIVVSRPEAVCTCVRRRLVPLTENTRASYTLLTSYVSCLHPDGAVVFARRPERPSRGLMLATSYILCEPPPLSAEALLCAAVRLNARPFDVRGLGVRTRLSEANECLLITMLSLS